MTTQTSTLLHAKTHEERSSISIPHQFSIMTLRHLRVLFRIPSAVIAPLFISAFFLFVYQASLTESAAFLPGLSKESYLAFILPVSIVSASLSSSAGQLLVRDIESGYFDKLLLTPVSRGALLFGPIIASAIITCLQAVIVLVIGLLMGLDSVTGILGLLAVLGFSLLLGMGFSGFTVSTALRSGNAAATQNAGFLFFPLTFLTATFVPLELLSGWLKTAAQFNPVTYILDAMRSVMLRGWEADTLTYGLLACAVLIIVPYIMALGALKSRTSRQ